MHKYVYKTLFPIAGSCNFESGVCTWTNDQTDQFDWTLGSGKTKTGGTGPTSDHTTKGTEGKGPINTGSKMHTYITNPFV